MATWFAQNSSVNIDSVNQWNSAANGSGSWLTWASLGASDVLVANGKTSITINVNVLCATLTTLATGGTAGGGFILPSGITVTAALTTGSSTVITRTASGTSYIAGDVSGSSTTGSVYTINNSGAGDLYITGNIIGPTSGSGTITVYHTGSGTIFITGNVTGSSSATNSVGSFSSSGLISITGNVTGGTVGSGVQVSSTAQVIVTGNVTAGTAAANGIICVSAGTTGAVKVTGDITAVGANAGIAIHTSAVTLTVIAYGNLVASSVGTAAIGNGRILIPAATQVRHEYQMDSAGIANGARSLYTGGTNLGQPTAADVRSGTTFGAASEYTGTLAVPSPTLVAIGVATDNTVGSYAPTGGLDAAGVRTAIGLASANLDTQLSGLATQASVDNLPTNAELATALGTADDAVLAAIATVQSDTNDIQTRLPAALESGRIAAVLDSATATQIDTIEAALTTLGSDSTTVERSVSDTNAITFSWPVSGASITGTASLNNGSYGAVAGAIAFLRTETGRHYYTLAYNVSDRTAAEGQVRYKFEDGTYTGYVVLRTVNLVTAAQVNAQVLDVLSVDTFGELSAPPAATSSLKDKLVWLFMWARNKATATATERKLYADDTTTIVSTETITDDGTTFTKGESL